MADRRTDPALQTGAGTAPASDHTGPAWCHLVKVAKPESESALAVVLLDEVADCYLAVPLLLRSPEQLAAIEARYEQLSAALDGLERAFPGLPKVSATKRPKLDREPRAPLVQGSRFCPGLPSALRVALDVCWAQPEAPDAPAPNFTDPNAQAFNKHLQIARTTPANLQAIRRYLKRERAAIVATSINYLTSRKRASGDVAVRQFKFDLGERLRELVGRPCDNFVTTVATALFPSDTVVTIEATSALRRREKVRRAASDRGE